MWQEKDITEHAHEAITPLIGQGFPYAGNSETWHGDLKGRTQKKIEKEEGNDDNKH